MNPEPYHFIFRNNKDPFIEELIEFREVINDLPETWSTFKPAKHFDRSVYIHLHQRSDLVMFAGSWKCPDWFTGRGNKTVSRFVNPNAQDARRYSMAGTRCACGNIVHHNPYCNRGEAIGEHAEGCTHEDRMRAFEEIEQIRYRRILKAGHFNQSQPEVADCVGLSDWSVSNRVDNWGMDWNTLRDIGKMRMKETINILVDMGYTHRKIAEALGIGASTVSDYVTGKIVPDAPTPVSV